MKVEKPNVDFSLVDATLLADASLLELFYK